MEQSWDINLSKGKTCCSFAALVMQSKSEEPWWVFWRTMKQKAVR